jgi:hypothetical protein
MKPNRKEIDTLPSWHRFTLPEEDRDLCTRRPFGRWFRSVNVVDLYKRRALADREEVRERFEYLWCVGRSR